MLTILIDGVSLVYRMCLCSTIARLWETDVLACALGDLFINYEHSQEKVNQEIDR